LRTVVFTLALAFTAALAALTGQDLANHGLTLPGVLGLLIVVLLMVGLIGALLRPPRR
jgi:hypothetical protein